MAKDSKPTELDVLKQALNHDWPEIQKHLSKQAKKEGGYQTDSQGNRIHAVNFDSWWLDRFDRKDVLVTLPGVVIMNTKPWHVGVTATQREAYDVDYGEDCADCFTDEDIQAHIGRFPEGQFMAMRISGPGAGHAVGMAVTMRTSRPPTAPVPPWCDAIGSMQLGAHEADGDWLYGVELAVRPGYQGHGIGSGLYEARFQLAKSLNLRGWYAVGILMGYQDHADRMDVVEYGEKVIKREIHDPTVTMQMNRGFRAERIVTDYIDEAAAGGAGVLIVWDNPDYEGKPE